MAPRWDLVRQAVTEVTDTVRRAGEQSGPEAVAAQLDQVSANWRQILAGYDLDAYDGATVYTLIVGALVGTTLLAPMAVVTRAGAEAQWFAAQCMAQVLVGLSALVPEEARA